MRRGAEAWVRRWWRGEAGWMGWAASVALLPAEWIFRGGTSIRNRLFDAGTLPARVAPMPVLSVGNLTVGGTGKTPVVRWFVDALQRAGARPGVAARGYGRDEVMLHRRWHPGVPVAAHPDRVRAVERLASAGAEVAILDDGFQHRRLARDVDVVLLAAETPFPGRRLPRGPYREGPAALERAGLIVITRKTATPEAAAGLGARLRERLPEVPVARVALRPGAWRALDGGAAAGPDGPALVLTAVAEPGGVRALVARRLARPEDDIELVAYPDHHEFVDGEVRQAAARGRALVVTEKDAVKLMERRGALQGRPVHVLTLELAWEAGREHADAVVARVAGARTVGGSS